MTNRKILFLLISISYFLIPDFAVAATLGVPCDLRCEYLCEPLAVQTTVPRLFWKNQSTANGAAQSAYRILVASTPDKLAADEGDLWDSGKVVSDESIQIEYAGHPLAAKTDCWWKVCVWDERGERSGWSAPSRWRMGLLAPSDWGGAEWITSVNPPPAATFVPPLRLRRTVTLDEVPKRAFVAVTGLGTYELYLNGRRVGSDVLAPEWTDYSKRIFYRVFDVTPLLRAGENVMAVELAAGWRGGPIFPETETFTAEAGRILCFKALLEAEAADGRRTILLTGSKGWLASSAGPFRRADIYYGADYDGTCEQPGWNDVGFDATGWESVRTMRRPCGAENAALVGLTQEPILREREIPARSVTSPKLGVRVFDLGQNIAGLARIRADLPRGTKVSLRFGEMLNDDGTLYRANLRRARQGLDIVWPGGLREIEARHTYFGYRYAEVTGLGDGAKPDDFTGIVCFSAAKETGRFRSSNDFLNRLMDAIAWTQKANMYSTGTDCPQRDERMGWACDFFEFARTASYNRDTAAFDAKYLQDLADEQLDDGRFPYFAPMGLIKRHYGTPGWGDAGVLLLDHMYKFYGDRRLCAERYENARHWVDYATTQSPEGIWTGSYGHGYGEWLNGDTQKLEGYPRGVSQMPIEQFATAYYAQSAKTLAQTAAILGKTEDAARYAALAAKARTAYRARYLKPDGTLKKETQAGYALTLDFGLADAAEVPQMMERMVALIRDFKGHLSTGIQTTHRLMNLLSENGYHDEANRLLHLRTLPSWGYMLDNGATTVWERWDGYVKGRGFQNPGMNSFNHWAIGAVGEWVWRTLAGIRLDESAPAWRRVVIAPQPDRRSPRIEAEYDSIRGTIAVVSDWDVASGNYRLTARIPPGVTATVRVPGGEARQVGAGSWEFSSQLE